MSRVEERTIAERKESTAVQASNGWLGCNPVANRSFGLVCVSDKPTFWPETVRAGREVQRIPLN